MSFFIFFKAFRPVGSLELRYARVGRDRIRLVIVGHSLGAGAGAIAAAPTLDCLRAGAGAFLRRNDSADVDG